VGGTAPVGSRTTPSSSPSPEENQGRSSQIRAPDRRVRRSANGWSGSVASSHRRSGTTSRTSGAAGRAELTTVSSRGAPASSGSSGAGSSAGGKYSAYRVWPRGV